MSRRNFKNFDGKLLVTHRVSSPFLFVKKSYQLLLVLLHHAVLIAQLLQHGLVLWCQAFVILLQVLKHLQLLRIEIEWRRWLWQTNACRLTVGREQWLVAALVTLGRRHSIVRTGLQDLIGRRRHLCCLKNKIIRAR